MLLNLAALKNQWISLYHVILIENVVIIIRQGTREKESRLRVTGLPKKNSNRSPGRTKLIYTHTYKSYSYIYITIHPYMAHQPFIKSTTSHNKEVRELNIL